MDDPLIPEIFHLNVIIILNRCKMHICHPNLFPLVDIRGPLHGQQHGVQHFLALFPVLLVIAPSGHSPRLVMICPVQAVPGLILEYSLPFAEACL